MDHAEENTDDSVVNTLKKTVRTPDRNKIALTFGGDDDPAGDRVCVAVRVRPMNKPELELGCDPVITVDQSENTILLKPVTTKAESKLFLFDAVFPSNAQQAELYNQVARPIVHNVLQGYNGTIFAYGQTGTGKTYTMEGNCSVPEFQGLIPNSFAQIFSHISHESGNCTFLVRVTYLEIYNEEIRDLLIGKEEQKKLEVKENECGVYVKHLSSFVVKSEKDMDRILIVGKKSRAVAATNMNAESSRSHTIFTVTVECRKEEGTRQSFRLGKLNLVDLAGSERASKSGATGLRLREGAKINLSLSCLGNVISALVDSKAHVPYRDSKLTRLLQDSLGGNAKTVMIANIGPAGDNYEETLSTLRYADRAKRITNHAHINEDPKDAILREFENEIESLKKQLHEEDMKLQKVIGGTNDDVNFDQIAKHEQEMLSGIRGELETQQRLSTAARAEAEYTQLTLIQLKDDVVAWRRQQERKAELQQKLEAIQKKIMVGGQSLLDKSVEQEAYLQKCMQELTSRREQQSKLQNSLTSKIAEKLLLEKRVLWLKDEQKRLQRETKKWSKVLKQEKLAEEIALEDADAEKEEIEIEISRLKSSINKDRAIIDQFIPEKSLDMIQRSMSYNMETESWKLTFEEYTGNNVRLAQANSEQISRNYSQKIDLSSAYESLPVEDELLKLDPFTNHVEYITINPVRTSDLLTSQETLTLLQQHDLLEDKPTFHFAKFEDDSDKNLYSKRLLS